MTIREVLKYRRERGENGRWRLPISDLEAVTVALRQQLCDVRERIVHARAEVEQSEQLASELEANLQRFSEGLEARRNNEKSVVDGESGLIRQSYLPEP